MRGRYTEVGTVYMSGTLEATVWVDISSTIAPEGRSGLVPREPGRRSGAGRSGGEVEVGNEGRRVGVAYAEAFRRLTLHV